MSKKRRSFTPEYKEEAAKLVIETSRPIAESARDIGINEQTLRNWVNAYRKAHAGEEPPLEFRYNTRRLHSALGYRTPQEVHNEYLEQCAAA